MNVQLIMWTGYSARRVIQVTKKRMIVGRDLGCDLLIPLASISRKHCELTVDPTGQRVLLQDLGSSNGTYQNHIRVRQKAVLTAGDEIRIGPLVFSVVIDGQPEQLDTPAPVASGGVTSNGESSTEFGRTSRTSPPQAVALLYLFADMNSFFASVEQQEQPVLRGEPVAVAPDLTACTGCLGASCEAQDYGVNAGMSVGEVRQRCPHVRLIKARLRVYFGYHQRVVQAVEQCLRANVTTETVDEMYGRLPAPEQEPERAASVARAVQHAIRRATRPCFHCSVSLGSNLWLAKVASDLNKPDGLTTLLPEGLSEAICHLPLAQLPGLTIDMERQLREAGITTSSQLCYASQAELAAAWGSPALAMRWWLQLRGRELPNPPTQGPCIGYSHVLPPKWRSDARAKQVAVRMVHKAAARTRQRRCRAGCLTLGIRYVEDRQWGQRVELGFCCDSLSMVRALRPLWSAKPTGTPLQIAIVLTHLVPAGSDRFPRSAGEA